MVGDEVSEEQLRLLIGEGRDPSSGRLLGRAYRVFAAPAARVAARVSALDPALVDADRAVVVARLEGEEAVRGTRRSVAGFDFTFSIPKSASILWAVGDARLRNAIEAAHNAAVQDVVAFLEREIAATRVGTSDGSGAVVQADVTGVVATAFDHFDSRAGDPHLHTHVVIANRVRTAADGAWRALDGRPLHAAVVALSELHEALVADRFTRDLGVEWEARPQGRDRNPSWAIATVPAPLVAVFSSRSRDIDAATDVLVKKYVTTHGHRPSKATVMKLRAEATLTTRPDKQVQSLDDLTARWRRRATEALGTDAIRWAQAAFGGQRHDLIRADAVSVEVVEECGRAVVAVVGEKRATWRHWNLVAEAARQTMGWRFATTTDRERMTAEIVAAAERASVQLTPPELATSPEMFRCADGSTRFRPRHSTVYSSEALLAAEARLLELGRDPFGPTVPPVVVRELVRRRMTGRRLGADQVKAVEQIATSGRVLDVLVGPAGAGKTTAMRGLRTVWEAGHGAGSVIGLAPSAAAAEVLAADLGIATENTAKWLHDHHAGTGATLRGGQLLIIDEASLAGTNSLDQIAGAVRDAGAKLLLVGDQAQLQAVDAGGAFAMLAADREDPAKLADVRRFRAAWEGSASLRLREGDASVLEEYASRARIRGGSSDDVTTQALTAWRADLDAGRTSLLIADNGEAVRDLNGRARAERILHGAVIPTDAVRLHDGAEASTGDVVITRRNDRRLRSGRGWVRNGDRWTVLSTAPDGSLTVRRDGRRRGGRLRLPAAYVAADVELGYAVTAHRAQGATVDTGHAVLTASSSRETAYVALTRGRTRNTAYVATDQPDEDHAHSRGEPGQDVRHDAIAVLTAVFARTVADTSAHEVLRREQDAAASIRVLAAEYDTIAAAAQHDRWTALLHASRLTSVKAGMVVASDAFGPLARTLRRAEAHHLEVAQLLDRAITARPLHDADDIAAVLRARLVRLEALRPANHQTPPRLIAGFLPEALGPMSHEMARALRERQELMETRAETLADEAIRLRRPWVLALGLASIHSERAAEWRREVSVVAAYRDRYAVTGEAPLGGPTGSANQQHDALLAAAAIARARDVAGARFAPRTSVTRSSGARPGITR